MLTPSELQFHSTERLQTRTNAINVLRDALYAIREQHNANFNKKAQNALETILKGEGYSILFHTHSHFDYSFKLWGNGVPQQDEISVYGWNTNELGAQCGWVEAALKEVDILDSSDTIERRAQEEVLYPEFEQMEQQIKALQEQINELRKKAEEYIQLLPIPSSAKRRKAQIYWNDAGILTRNKFPNIWPEERR